MSKHVDLSRRNFYAFLFWTTLKQGAETIAN